jgi:hypothetical protein
MMNLTLIIAFLLLLPLVLCSAFFIQNNNNNNKRVDSSNTISALLLFNERFDIQVFHDVHLPDDMSVMAKARNELQLQRAAAVTFQTDNNGAQGIIDDDLLIGTPKKKGSYEMRCIQQIMINRYIKTDINDPPIVPGYLYFGNNNFSKILAMLCQVNPFFASALTFAQEGDTSYLELIAYDTKPEQSATSDSKYLKFMRNTSDPSHRINVRFNMDMTVNKITKFDQDGQATIVDLSDWDKYASGAIYNVFYYASAYHSIIHVLHYLMTTGIKSSTDHDTALSAWAEPYDDNIPLKFIEVATLLIQSSIRESDDQIVTGKDGFGASPAIKKDMRDILCSLGRCKTAQEFMDMCLLSDLKATCGRDYETVIEEANILTEFRKHIDLVQPFGEDLANAMRGSDEKSRAAFDETETLLTQFMSDTGAGVSEIDSISSWVQLMSCTGIMHGSTLSYTRLIGVPEINRWRDINKETYDQKDVGIVGGVLGTLAGMTLERHVFTSEMNVGRRWNTKDVSDDVMDVLEKYNQMSLDLKKMYKAEISEREDFREYGWILTDHCPDGYDGKQHTITAYL